MIIRDTLCEKAILPTEVTLLEQHAEEVPQLHIDCALDAHKESCIFIAYYSRFIGYLGSPVDMLGWAKS